MPLVSIGMPVFNDKAFLVQALDSLLQQTFTDFELIISDDGSTDGSEEVCRQYAARDERIQYVRQPKNLGISRNMMFLLKEASAEYFMWAANDDVWDKTFIEVLYNGLRSNDKAVVAFCPKCTINEENELVPWSPPLYTDYSGASPEIRLKKLIHYFDDTFGYALFKREAIMDVRFPVWWWINKKCAYNNIYPTLCYYLTKGDYVFRGDKPLFLNRLKNDENVNHKIPYPDKYVRGTFAFILRKYNLFYFSAKEIVRAGGSLGVCLSVLPPMFSKWFVRESYNYTKHQTKRFLKGELSFF